MEGLTVLLLRPSGDVLKTTGLEQLAHATRRILEALLDLDSVVSRKGGAECRCLPARRDKGLMPTALAVVDILADDSPVGDSEDLLAEEMIDMSQTVQDKTTRLSERIRCTYAMLRSED